MQFIKNNFLSFVVLVLLVVILLQRGCEKSTPSLPTVKRDTIWVTKDSLIISKPQVIKTITIGSHDTTIINHYTPDTNYGKLVKQYQEVVNQLLAINIHKDSLRIDTNGYVKITDSVQKNLIVGRSTEVNIKYPVIKETITIPYKPVSQLYIGGGLEATRTNINQLNSGLLYKTKKDQIFGATIGLNNNGNVVYGVSSYWKLKLK
jgi:hypothetical protein